MIKNYLVVAVRNLIRHKVYSTINILGLAIGMASCVLIVLYVADEFSYDRYHKHADRSFRVLRETRQGDGGRSISKGTSGALAGQLREDFSEVEDAVRVWNMGVWVTHEDRVFRQAFCLADANILEMFTFPLVKGDPATVLNEPFTILLTESMVEKYFGDENPIGKVMTVEGRYFSGDYTVTGILKDMPRNSSPNWRTGLQFDFLTSTAVTSRGIVRGPWENWNRGENWFPVKTYIRLAEGYAPRQFEQKLPDFMAQHLGAEVQAKSRYLLQPLTRIYLYSNVDFGRPGTGGITFVHMLEVIALFILVIASINFMNLATARYTTRAREVSMRKVAGAHWGQLIQQFLGESIFLSFLAMALAVGLVELALPTFNAFARKELALIADPRPSVILGLTGFTLLVGLLAGSYPALFLSSLPPIGALKGTVKTSARAFWMRRGLVVFQFSTSILLIIGTIVVQRQINFIQNTDLGFHRDNMFIMPIFAQDREAQTESEGPLSKQYEVVKHEFSQYPQVLKVAASVAYGTAGGWQVSTVRPEGLEESGVRLPVLGIDEDFLDTYDIPIVRGRNFSTEIPTDAQEAFMVNETAVRQFGWTDPIGKALVWGNRKGTVIGVIKDFHHRSLREKIDPIVLCMSQSRLNFLNLRIRGENIPETMAFLKQTWKRFLPSRPFAGVFLEANLNGRYGAEIRFGQIARVFSVLAIFISCLGLFGLVSFNVAQRTREIGVRKVLGASVPRVVLMLIQEPVKWVIAANVIAWPVAYYATEAWLQAFVYRVDVDVWPFLLGGFLALLIALATVSYQAVRAATANPVDALRYE